MYFENDLYLLKHEIAQAQNIDELNYIRTTNEKKYWWTSIFVAGLFYALNGAVGKMILTWVLGFFTIGIYSLYVIYTSYRDQNEFNNEMEYLILQRTNELRQTQNVNNDVPKIAAPEKTFLCPNCGLEVNDSLKFCPNCGNQVEAPHDNKVTFCSNCGAEIVDGAKFCHNCGNTLIR